MIEDLKAELETWRERVSEYQDRIDELREVLAPYEFQRRRITDLINTTMDTRGGFRGEITTIESVQWVGPSEYNADRWGLVDKGYTEPCARQVVQCRPGDAPLRRAAIAELEKWHEPIREQLTERRLVKAGLKQGIQQINHISKLIEIEQRNLRKQPKKPAGTRQPSLWE